jgi:hypothetical protein
MRFLYSDFSPDREQLVLEWDDKISVYLGYRDWKATENTGGLLSSLNLAAFC